MRKLLLILIVFLNGYSLDGWAQSAMPDKLDINYLLSQKKYRNIHHDSFCRDGNYSEIGNNALPERPTVLAYKTIEKGKIKVGIQNHCATNFNKTANDGRCIKYVNTDRNVYHITAVKPKDSDGDVKVAFWIKDINNFYYARLDQSTVSVYRYSKGKERKVYKAKKAGVRLEIFVNNRNYEIYVDGLKVCKRRFKGSSQEPSLCGLYFDNTAVSWVDDFIVDYPDTFEDADIDSYVEQDLVKNPSFGTYCAEEGACTASIKYTNGSRRSYRFELMQPTQEMVNKNRNNALHSTIMLNCKKEGGYKPLDSFVLSVDFLFPEDDDELWQLDELFAETFIQVHHAGYNIPFSPSLSININKGRVYLSTIWLEPIAKGPSPFNNDLNYRAENIMRLNNDMEEQYLEHTGYGNYSSLPYIKGEWHNITIYAKLGYNMNQAPRTVIYLDNKLILDWDTPNAYNCQEYGEFMEFGVYKWDWNTEENRKKTPIKKRVIYFDNIRYYI